MFLEPTRFARAEVELGADERHYLITVRRCQDGDTLVVFDGTGREADARLSVPVPGPGKDAPHVSLHVTARRTAAAVRIQVTLACALLKGSKMDLVVQKATELGVHSLRPLRAARSVSREASGNRLQRWRKIAREAARQCGRADVPSIAAPEPLQQALSQMGKPPREAVESRWLLDPNGAPFASVAAAANLGAAAGATGSIVWLVGPEGGFDEAERKLIADAGFQPVSVAQYTLRAETAAIAACAAVAILASRP